MKRRLELTNGQSDHERWIALGGNPLRCPCHPCTRDRRALHELQRERAAAMDAFLARSRVEVDVLIRRITEHAEAVERAVARFEREYGYDPRDGRL